ncbi:MAG: hypothetical protein KDD06_08700 [Phaeodactylibacter sp.]|nr:hypothetical protein [Phaeodactylibacter sp.]
MPSTVKRINTWSSPRNVSTALMYAFAQRKDTQVFDEPLYAHYLSSTQRRILHPGAEEIIASQEKDGEKVVRRILLGSHSRPIAFFKQMAHHLIGLDESFLLEMDNVLLIRDPQAIIFSYNKVIPNPSMEDIGIKKMYSLFQFLSENGRLSAVVDSRELLSGPESVLRQLCRRLSITFDKDMLKWKPGSRPEDGVWARYWYSRVHRSSGFEPFLERDYELPARLRSLAAECRPYYEKLYAAAIKAEL